MASVELVEQVLFLVPIDQSGRLGLRLHSTELIILRGKVVGKIAEKIEL